MKRKAGAQETWSISAMSGAARGRGERGHWRTVVDPEPFGDERSCSDRGAPAAPRRGVAVVRQLALRSPSARRRFSTPRLAVDTDQRVAVSRVRRTSPYSGDPPPDSHEPPRNQKTPALREGSGVPLQKPEARFPP